MYFYYKIFEKDEKLQKYQIPIFFIFSFFVHFNYIFIFYSKLVL